LIRAVSASLLFATIALCSPVIAEAELHEITVTVQRVASPLDDSSFSLSVLDERAVEDTAAVHVSELLSKVPGVLLGRGNGQEHLTAIRSPVLTGAGSCGAFYMAEDGIPLRAPGFCNVNQLFDVNTEQASRVEVLRGSGAAIHGGNALNGVINVIGPAFGSRQRVDIEAGEFGYTRAKASYVNDNLAVAVNVTNDEGYRDDSGFDQQKISIRHRGEQAGWQRTSGLSLSNLNQNTAGFIQGFEAYKDQGRKTENADPEAFRDSFSARGYARFEKNGVQLTPYFRHTQMSFLQHFLPQDPLEENGQSSIGIQSSLSGSKEQLSWQAGVDADITRGWLKETQTSPTSGPFPTGKHYDYEVDALMLAGFGSGSWQHSSDTQVNAGIRYELQHYRYDNQMIDGNTAEDGSACTPTCRYARPADRNDSFNAVSANAGFNHDLSPSSQLVFNLAHGFRAPQATELYRLQATQLNAELKPVRQNNVELGWRADWQAVSLSTVAFYINTKNQILRNSNRENFNGGETSGRGVEIEIDWLPIDALRVHTAYSYAQHRYEDDLVAAKGNDVDTAPRNLGNLSISWQASDQLGLNIDWQYQGSYFTEPSNQQKYEGHDLVSLGLKLGIDATEFGVKLHNVFDSDYADRADFAFGNHRYFVGQERTVFVSVGHDFDS
jgi:outer membrane receptor protein involved in Fe transport